MGTCALCDGPVHGRSLCRPHYDRSRRYNLTVDDLRILDGREWCDSCLTRAPAVVDHDHATGAVRGVLCTGCNLLLGHARDSISVLVCAIRYLSRSPS